MMEIRKEVNGKFFVRYIQQPKQHGDKYYRGKRSSVLFADSKHVVLAAAYILSFFCLLGYRGAWLFAPGQLNQVTPV